jgi:hypothetical protein
VFRIPLTAQTRLHADTTSFSVSRVPETSSQAQALVREKPPAGWQLSEDGELS